MKKRRRRRRSPPKVSHYRRVVGRLPHSMVALAVVTVGLTFGLASVGWAVNGKPLLAGNTNTATQPTVLDKAGAGPALDLRVDSGPALAVNTTDLVTNLNADQLDGMGADSFATQSALNDERAAREAADTTLQNNINAEARARNNADNQLKTDLATADQAPNEQDDPVDWSNLKGVPEGFADGEDAVGSTGAANNIVVERLELVKPPSGSILGPTEVVFETAAFEILAECHQVSAPKPVPPGAPPPAPGQTVSVPVARLSVVAKEPDLVVWVNRYSEADTVDSQVHHLETGQKAILAGPVLTPGGFPDPVTYGTYFVDAPSGFLGGEGTATFEFDPATVTIGNTCRLSVNGLGKEVSS